MDCTDLRLGGTLSATGITGGTSINNYAYAIEDWSNLLGTAGMTASVQSVNSRPGGVIAGDRLSLPRFPTLSVTITDRNATGGITEPTFAEQKEANTDALLALLANPAGNYLEVEMADATTRFIYVYNLDPAPVVQPRRKRTIRTPLFSPFPYWKAGGNQSSDTISGGDTLVNGGNAPVYDAVLTFAGAGTFTHSGLGWSITTTGACVVDLGARTVTVGSNPAENLMRHTDKDWGWFLPGSNSVTADVSVGVVWRASWN